MSFWVDLDIGLVVSALAKSLLIRGSSWSGSDDTAHTGVELDIYLLHSIHDIIHSATSAPTYRNNCNTLYFDMNPNLAHYLNRPVEQHNKDAFMTSRRVHMDTKEWIQTAHKFHHILIAIKKVHSVAASRPALSDYDRFTATSIIEDLKAFCCALLVSWGGPPASAPLILDQLLRMTG